MRPESRVPTFAALAVFFACAVSAVADVTAGLRAPYRTPAIERYFIIQKASLEAGAYMASLALRPPPGGGGGTFNHLRAMPDSVLSRLFIANPVWQYSLSLPSDTLLRMHVVMREDAGNHAGFHNANGDTGKAQFRMDISPGRLPELVSEN